MVRATPFARNVFVNYPFDDDYSELLRPLTFTLLSLGYNPRLASECSDSGENRIDKICQLIRESRLSIHDLSRLKASAAGEFYRMNMPFELGIEYGCRRFGIAPLRTKRCLILEKGLHDFRRALSDLSGVDIKSHSGEPVQVVRAVRDWLVETAELRRAPSTTVLWYSFTNFATDFYDTRKKAGFSDEDLNMMPIPEYLDSIRDWVSSRGVYSPK